MRSSVRLDPNPCVVKMPKRNVYRAEIEAFSDAVLRDREPPVAGEAGLISQRILEAVYRSGATGKRKRIR